jgi:hypothetical protein
MAPPLDGVYCDGTPRIWFGEEVITELVLARMATGGLGSAKISGISFDSLDSGGALRALSNQPVLFRQSLSPFAQAEPSRSHFPQGGRC